MSLVSILYALLFYFAAAVLCVGILLRIRLYAHTPQPLKIPTTPAPATRAGVVMRMVREVVFFQSLFKGCKWTWLFGWIFHFALLLVLIRHLRYFIEPIWAWIVIMQPWGVYAGFAMLAGLAGLWIRRIAVDRVRYISTPSDHLMLLLLIGIAGSGLLMKYVWPTDIIALKVFFLGLLSFDWQPLAPDPLLLLHLALTATLMIVFPFSKLLHAPGFFFSPTRNQTDNPRERRHLNTWATEPDTGSRP